MTHHSRDAKTHGPIDFVGIDGEGITVKGKHRYVLFGIGDKQIEDSNGLGWHDVFEFLYDNYRPRTAYTGFFLGYDFTQIIKTMPEDRAYMLLTSEGRALRKRWDAGKTSKKGISNTRKLIPHIAPHPVEYDGWQFDMLAMKRLRIRPKTCECPYPTCKCKKSPWMYICDVGSFFQSSFLTVIDPKGWNEGTQVVTDEEFAVIKEGKEKRSTAVLDDDMRQYNVLENQVLARVMRTLDNGFKEIGIHLPPSKWFGPGQAAQTWLKNEDVPTAERLADMVPIWFYEAARMSYFGGWFELFMHGIVPGITHEYDINSAYPSVIAKLPCLIHGTYTHGEGLPTVNDGDLCLVYAEVMGNQYNEKNIHIGAMLHRFEDGSICRPLGSAGWFWWDELKAAEKCRMIKPLNNKGHQKVLRWVKYEPCDCPPPMAAIRDLYQKRLDVGKKSPLGKAAKLVYNSAYGKFAQSVGEPIFGNSIYASRITSGCRTMILNAIASHPNGKADVAMIATDGVYFLTEHPTLPLSAELGEWEHTSKSNLTLFKPGVYWDDVAREDIANGESPHFKARGFKASDFASQISRIDKEFADWATECPTVNGFGKYIGNWPKVTFIPNFAMTTALQALRRNKWELAGAVIQKDDEEAKELVQNSNPFEKRWELNRVEYDGRIIYRSQPLRYFNDIRYPEWFPSEPYTKRFGMEDPWSDEYKERMGTTPDGNVVDVLAWILKGE